MTSHIWGARAGHRYFVLEDEEEADELIMQAGLAASSIESMGDVDLDSSNGSDNSPTVDDPSLCGKLRMTEELMTEIVLRCGVPSKFV